MPLHIIIDGYNLIHQSTLISISDQLDFQQIREVLIDRLSDYKKIRKHKITVVFDGLNAPGFSRRREVTKGIEVKFSRRGETADTVIKRMAAREKQKALIVSSDREITDFAASQGAATIASAAFGEKIYSAESPAPDLYDAGEKNGWQPTTRKKGPRRRLSRRERHNRLKTRKL